MSDPTDLLDTARVLAALQALGVALPPGPVRVDGYGDSPALSRELLNLIAAGRKRAGTSLLWSHQHDGQALPAVGDLEIAIDHAGRPALLTRITETGVRPFDQVDARYAALEGEGDGSLAWWRRAHERFFAAECARIGRMPSADMPVVCSVFELLQVLPGADTGPTVRPLEPEDAEALFPGLAEPSLYTWIPQRPPATLQALRETLARQCAGAPPDSGETWLNWLLLDGGQAAGRLQATRCADGALWIGYIVLPGHQGRGLASQGVAWMLGELQRRWPGQPVWASVDVRHPASARVLARNGFVRLRTEAAELHGQPSTDAIHRWQPAFPT